MAVQQSSSVPPKFYTALDPFNKLKVKIGLELTRVDVRVLKSALVGKIPNEDLNKIDSKYEGGGFDLLDCLQRFGFFSENNLGLLKEGLETANRVDLVVKLEKFGKTITEVKDAPLSLMATLPAPSSTILYLHITGQRNSIGDSRIQILKESLSSKLSIKVSDVPIMRMTETNQLDCTLVTLQFPSKNDQIDQLILAAVNKAEWLVNLGVLRLQIEGKAPISIDEKVLEISQVPLRETRALAIKPGFHDHRDNALDLILVLEVPFSVTPHVLKKMVKHCQPAINALSQCFDMRLAIVTYGNHCSSQPAEVPAFLPQDFSYNFDFTSHVKNMGQCGGEGGPSGLADALVKVKEISEGQIVRKEATKLCILINFLVEDTMDLNFYKCSHDNDVIQLCGSLADNGVTLYIFGVEVSLLQQGNVANKEKNFFLEGIADIGGGRYFQLENVGHLNEAITCVSRHDISIEKQGKTTGEIVKQDMIRNHDIIRINGLPKELGQKLTENGITVDTLKENGKSLKQVSKLAQRVSFSDTLDELIESLGTSKLKQDSRSRSCKGRSQARMELGESSGLSKALLGKKGKELHQKCSISLMENQAVDLECAVRIMRRQLHRLAYFEITEPEDQEMMSVDN